MEPGISRQFRGGAALFAAALLCTPALAADAPASLDDRPQRQPLRDRLVFFAGGDIASDSAFGWSGILAGSPQVDGSRLRVTAAAGRYRYRTGAVAGGVNEADVTSGELMFGYRRKFGETIATFFAGAHVEHQALKSPDPGHRAQGTKAGVKAAIELYRRFTPTLFGTAAASASTVHGAYHVRVTLAHEHRPGIAAGIEAALNGDARYHEPRAGVFLQSTYGRTTLSLAGGVLSNSDRGGGAYATVSVAAPY